MSRPRIAPPPSPFPSINVWTMKAGLPLHRTHSATLSPAQFNPGLGQPTRFAPFQDAASACVPSLYAATTLEAAVFESIFHDIPPKARFKTVRLAVVEARQVSLIAPARDLRLAQLFAPDLKAWGITRGELIDTPKSTYGETAKWAAAIHATHADVDGLLWTSRQCDPDLCFLLFGDRVSETDFDELETRRAGDHADLILEIRGFGTRAGIVLAS